MGTDIVKKIWITVVKFNSFRNIMVQADALKKSHIFISVK